MNVRQISVHHIRGLLLLLLLLLLLFLSQIVVVSDDKHGTRSPGGLTREEGIHSYSGRKNK